MSNLGITLMDLDDELKEKEEYLLTHSKDKGDIRIPHADISFDDTFLLDELSAEKYTL